MTRTTASIIVMFSVIGTAFVLLTSTETIGGPPPDWNASKVIESSDLIAVIEGPSRAAFVSAPDVFLRDGTAIIRRFTIIDILHGDLDQGTEIVVVQPPGHMHGYANILPGQSLLFLRRMSQADVNHLREQRERPPSWWDEDLGGEVWTFAWDRKSIHSPDGPVPGPDGYQWMSWIQLKIIRPDGEIDEQPRSILAAQLTRFTGVEQEREAILTYVQGLVTLRQAVLAGAELSDEENLDRFQQAVMQGAVKELQESRTE